MKTLSFVTVLSLFGLACSADVSSDGAGGAGAGDSGAGDAGAGDSGAGDVGAGDAGGASAGGTSAGGSSPGGGSPEGGSGAGGGPTDLPDPNLDGSLQIAAVSGTAEVAATGDDVPITGFAPTSGGPYPVIVIGHGFQLPTTQYEAYAARLATFGYVALLPDFPTSFFGTAHTDVAENLLGALDWAASAPELAGKADSQNAGMTGHSLGGKGALLAATYDARVKAVIALDPVDSAMNCNPTDCPDVSNLMPSLGIPTGFLGETTDATGGFMACAPAADNYATFYAGAQSPSFSVTVLGANHMSFLDDVASCGFTCSFCNMATAPNAQVNAMARAYVTAFFERHLKGLAGYDAYLTGDVAQMRYVSTNQATIVSK
jgi:dienelactone hydrolase